VNPVYGQYQAEVNRMGTPEYAEAERARAMANVQQQAQIAQDAEMRGLTRMGVNPMSGRSAALGNQQMAQLAASRAAAAFGSDRSVKDSYLKGLSGLTSMSGDIAKTGQAFGSLGLDTAKTGQLWSTTQGNQALQNIQNQMTNKYQMGNLAQQKYATDMGLTRQYAENTAAADRQSSSDLSGLLGLAAYSFLN